MNKTQTIRPTKKQRELLTFIQNFIQQHGYSPSYREIMNGCAYNSVATVAVHINNLISRGHLRKRDNSARSLEVISHGEADFEEDSQTSPEERWLVGKVEQMFKAVEKSEKPLEGQLDELYVLTGALKVLGFAEESDKFITRLQKLKQAQPIAKSSR